MPNLPELGGPSQKIVLTRIRPEKNERRFYAVSMAFRTRVNLARASFCGDAARLKAGGRTLFSRKILG